MPSWNPRANEIFLAALEIDNAERRREHIAAACGDDAELRRQVEELLAAHEQAGSFLGQPATAPYRPGADDASNLLGQRIGPYALLQQIGEGGMGVVYLAEQEAPIRRLVALKIIKPGLDTGQVIARFEAERQALALMDHPNIARVLDAGTTEPRTTVSGSGRPYFVMELVSGIPITRFCDQEHLTPRERLELLIPVCQAVQHAHQKGIIHRDLKPSNVIVGIYDGKAVPKVIDFGVAKAIQQRLTERTMFTEAGAIVGTIEYMSPEQAELNNLDIDTRADIYSLGVLLYELLAGSPPFTSKQLRAAAFDEMLRMIREVEPPKPSTKLSSSENLPSIAANRKLEPKRLTKLMHGDLDWIAMKCLEKDRRRRYETANQLAMELRRYLADEAVLAGPPSAWYRMRKFVRRNRGAVLAVSAILLALVGGIIGTSVGLVRAEEARQGEEFQKLEAQTQADLARKNEKAANENEAISRAVLDFVETRIFSAARPKNQAGGQGFEVRLRDAIEAALPFVDSSFTGQPLVEARLRDTMSLTFRYLGEINTAVRQSEKAYALYLQYLGPDDRRTLWSANRLASSYAALGKITEALELREQTISRLRSSLGSDHADTIASMFNLALSYHALGRYAEAADLLDQALSLCKANFGSDDVETLRVQQGLALSYAALGRTEESLKLRESTLRLRTEKLGSHHPETLESMNNLAASYHEAGRYVDALKLFEQALAISKSTLGRDHPETLRTMSNIAECYAATSQIAEALNIREQVLALRKTKLGPDHPDTLDSMNNVAASHEELGRNAEALRMFAETVELRKAKLGASHPATLMTLANVAFCLVKLDRGQEAVTVIDECLSLAKDKTVDPRLIPFVMDLRLRHFQNSKDSTGCRTTAEMWEMLNRTDSDSLYTAACFRAVTAAIIKIDPNTPTGEATRVAKQEADRAMEWLRKSIAAGYKDVAHVKEDKDLDSLRDRSDFQKLVTELEQKFPPKPNK